MSSKGTSNADEARRLWAAGALLGVVIATLLLAVVLEADPVREAPPLARQRVTSPPERAPLPAVEPEVTPRAEEAPSDLASRARRDAARLSAEGQNDPWTLQLLMACDESALHRTLERAGTRNRLALVEAADQGSGCYRLLWGRYRSRDAAAAARDVPADLLPAGERPWPRPIRQVLAP